MGGPFKYRAFLSYSHADAGAARKVHARLETFHIDKDVVGRKTPLGLVPANLRPIFRDRNDFDAGASLGDQTLAALEGSAALILIASPRSALSRYVNEEIRLFKSRHPDRAVIPLIVDGEPGGGENECFPPALRFIVDAEGFVTDRPADVLAADLREKGDGFNLALAKAVARLIGLSPDDVFRRAERERRRQARVRAAVIAVVLALAGAGSFLFWQSRQRGVVIAQQGATLAEIQALVEKYSPVGPAAAAPGARESLTASLTGIAQGAAADPRYAEALELLKQGKPAEAVPLLKAVAEDKAKRADRDAKDAAAAYRNLASIAAVSDHKSARDYYAEAARLDPTDIEGMVWNGEFQAEAGDLRAAEAAYTRVIDLTKAGANDHDAIWARLGLGDIQKDRGNLGAALATYQEAEGFADRLAKTDPGNTGRQRDLSASYDRIGDVLVAQGHLPEALNSYRDGLAIADRLAKSDPGNAGWQLDLAASYSGLADVFRRTGDKAKTRDALRRGREIMLALTALSPDNSVWKKDLAWFDGQIAVLRK